MYIVICASWCRVLHSTLEDLSSLNQFMNHSSKLRVEEFSILIVRGEAYQFLLENSQKMRQWEVVSKSLLQRGQRGLTLMLTLIRLDLEGITLVHAFHKKCLIFWGVGGPDNLIQGRWEKVGIEWGKKRGI